MSGLTNLAQVLFDLGCLKVPAGARDVVISGVCIDSREVQQGDLFVALLGEKTDGHRYVAAAIREGAVAALISRPIDDVDCIKVSEPPDEIQGPVTILVEDTLAALQLLATARRARRSDLQVVAVTGSVGKTTTKEAIASVLSQKYCTLKSEGNHNNEIGLPLTLMALEERHSHAVLEMGMYALGEIALLCRIARPNVGVVTNVQPLHLERLGTIERIAEAKSELPRALTAGGVAILNGDDERVTDMPLAEGVSRILCGFGANNNIRADEFVNLGMDGMRFTVHVSGLQDFDVDDTQQELRTSTIGRHTVNAALLAVTVGLIEGLNWEQIAAGLVAQGHGLRLVPRVGREGVRILDDSYNAGPASMKAALDVLAEMPGRRVAILGDMLELGALEDVGHREVGRHCLGRVDQLLTVGTRARLLAESAIEVGLPAANVMQVASADEAVQALADVVQFGDTVLVKGSHSMGLEVCVEALEDSARG